MPNKLPVKFPQTLVLPNTKDFCQNEFQDGKTCCLVGWANIAFGPKTITNDQVETFEPDLSSFGEDRLRARNIFLAEVLRVGEGGDSYYHQATHTYDDEPQDDPIDYSVEECASWNDSRNDLKTIARAWRKAAKNLGYDVVDTVVIR